eukprot:768741-Hanusia_phi.AAC.10
MKPEHVLAGKELERYSQLVSIAEQERNLNKQMLKTLYGSEVHSGDPVQLKHVNSDRFLKFAFCAASSTESLRVVLDEASDASSFSLTCPYKQEAGKTRISLQDHVYVCSDHSLPGFLGCSAEEMESAFQANCNAVSLCVVPRPMKFLLHLYQDAAATLRDEQANQSLLAGSVVQLFQPSSSSLLSAVSIEGSDMAVVVAEKVASMQGGSLLSLWVVEQEDPSVGGSLTLKSSFRLRNLATGGYLCPCRTLSSDMAMMTKRLRYWSDASAEYLTYSCFEFRRPMESEVVEDGVSEQVLFWLCFNSWEEAGSYLHLRPDHPALLLPSPGSSQGFLLSPVSQETSRTASRVIRACRLLQAKTRGDAAGQLTCEEMIEALEVLRPLTVHLKSLLRDSRRLLLLQQFLRQSGLIAIMLDVANRQKLALKPDAASRELRGFFQNPMVSYSGELLSEVFQFLQVAMADNEAVCQEVFLALPLDLLFFSDAVGSGAEYLRMGFVQRMVDCYLQVYRTSFSALFDMNFSVLEVFLRVLEKYQLASHFIFCILRSILSYKNVKLRNNAKTVFNTLFKAKLGILLPRTALLDGVVHVCLDVDWKDKRRWRKAGVLAEEEATAAYYNEFQLLLSALCQNEEWFGPEALKFLEQERFLSLEAASLMISNDQLPLSVRSSLSLVVSTVYIKKTDDSSAAILDGLFVLWPRLFSEDKEKTVSVSEESLDVGAILAQLKASILKALEDARGLGSASLEYVGAQTRLLHELLVSGFYDKEMAQALSDLQPSRQSLPQQILDDLVAAFFRTLTLSEPSQLHAVRTARLEEEGLTRVQVNDIRIRLLETMNLLCKV